jgi:hypothetical protein
MALPVTLLSKITGPNTCRKIISSKGFFIVLYKGEPFNLLDAPAYTDEGKRVYCRTGFPNPGFAQLLADKLNDQFSCSDFTVAQWQRQAAK